MNKLAPLLAALLLCAASYPTLSAAQSPALRALLASGAGGEAAPPTPTPSGSSLMAVRAADLAVGADTVTSGYWPQSSGPGAEYTVVSDASLVPDFGAVHLLEPDLSAETCETDAWTDGGGYGYDLTGLGAGEVVDPFTFTLEISATDAGGAAWDTTLTGWTMHGATRDGDEAWDNTFDFGAGSFRENRRQGGFPIQIALDKHLGAGWSASAEFCYRKTASARRLVLTGYADGSALDDRYYAEWYGVTPHADSLYFDNTDALNWSFYDQRAGESDYTTLELASGGTYYYRRGLNVAARADSTVLRGQGGVAVTADVDDYGYAFRPVRRVADPTILAVLPPAANAGTPADWYFHTNYAFGDARYVAPGPSAILGYDMVQMEPETGASKVVLEHLVMDGATSANRAATFGVIGSYPDSFTRNKPGWTGISIGNEGGKAVPDTLVLRGVEVSDYAATNVLGDGSAVCVGRDVRLGSASGNHSLYALCELDFVNYTQTGEAWTHIVPYGGLIQNLVIEDMEVPYKEGVADIVGVRGGQNASDCDDVDAWSGNRCGLTIDTLYADVRGTGDRSTLISATGPELVIDEAVLVQDTVTALAFIGEGGNGQQTARYAGVRITDVEVHFPVGFQGIGDEQEFVDGLKLENGYLARFAQTGGGEYGRLVKILAAPDRARPDTASGPVQSVYQSFGSSAAPVSVSQFAIHNFSPDDAAYSRTFLDSVFVEVGGETIVRSGDTGTGSLAAQTLDYQSGVDSTRLYWSDGEVTVGANGGGNATIFLAASHFLRMTDPATSATSEDTVEYTCSGGESSFLVATNLLAVGHPDYELVDYSASDAGIQSLVTGTNWADSGGTDLSYTSGGDLRQPYLEVTLSGGCTGGDVFRADLAVSEWKDPDGNTVTLP